MFDQRIEITFLSMKLKTSVKSCDNRIVLQNAFYLFSYQGTFKNQTKVNLSLFSNLKDESKFSRSSFNS